MNYRMERRVAFEEQDGRQMDAIIKAIRALADGQPLPAEFTDIEAARAAIKTKYPKP